MLPAKTRFAPLFAVALFVVLSAMTGHSTGQDPPQPKKPDTKLRELLEERRAAAQQLAKKTRARVLAGLSSGEEMVATTRLAFDAALELCKTDPERIKVLGDFLEAAKDNERIALDFLNRGQGREVAMLFAKVERLRVEIALERAKEKGGAGPEKVQPPQPKKADAKRTIQLPATVEAFESAWIFSRTPGFALDWKYDIGDRVKKNALLIKLFVPELEQESRMKKAQLSQAEARLEAAQAAVAAAAAQVEAAKLGVEQAAVGVKSAAAAAKLRESQYRRMKALFDEKGVEEKVLDESQDRHSAAAAADKSAQLAFKIAQSLVAAAQAKADQAKADVTLAKAGIAVAHARVEEAKERLSRAEITAPFDGIITQRNVSAGDFVQSGSANQKPLYVIQDMHIVRVIVLIPEADVPALKHGDKADLVFAAFPGKKWSGSIQRTAGVLDPKTRCMRAEIWLDNPDNRLAPGMFANVTIQLGESK